jgi:chemotaxis protein MotB
MSEENQIIVIKKVKGHSGHHGGAWKVAYADFVTAMMALFIVLWLMNSSKPIQEAVGGYFRDPHGMAAKKGSNLAGMGDASAVKKEDMGKLKEQLLQSLRKMANFDKIKNQIEMTVTPEGLRIELIEGSKGTFFENGKAQPTPALGELLKVLSVEAGKLPNPISIEGHTDAKPFSQDATYGNWELSTDRANMARRLMQQSGLHPHQVVQVRGYADNNLRDPANPQDPANRRVTVLIQYEPNPDDQKPGLVFSGDLPRADIPSSNPPAVEPAKVPEPAKTKEVHGSE